MDKNCVYIVIVVVLFLFIFIKISNRSRFEHLTNDEAVKNIASLYNTGQLTATNLTATGLTTTPKLQLGNKWVLSGVAGTDGLNDSWLRLLGPDGKYYGGLAADKLWVSGAYNSDVATALNDLNNRVNATNAANANLTTQLNNTNANIASFGNCNWDGDRSIYGGNGGCEDDFTFTCTNKKLVKVRNHCYP